MDFMIYVFQPSSAASSPSASTGIPGIQWSWATLTGPDALDFLHRITTVNTQAMQTSEGAKGCLLSAQGKLRAFFTLWNYGDQEYAFEWDAGQTGHWKTALFTAIDQYTFAEKITLTDVTALECRWIFSDSESDAEIATLLGIAPSESFSDLRTLAIEDEIRICHHGKNDFGKTWITAWGRPARLSQWMDQRLSTAKSVSLETVEAWRIDAARPWIDHELTENTVPLEAGLTDAIATNKGCYPGQEVIEKIISLGSPAKRLAMIEGSGPVPAPGSKILNTAEPPAEVGEITSAHAIGNGFKALGYVRKIHAKEGFMIRIGGSPAAGSLVRIAPYA
jgi:folate-binding protein YgfZ